MTTTIDLATVTDSISNLVISGVTIKDIDQIPDIVGLATATLYPKRDGLITNYKTERTDVTGQNLNVYYTLNYQYFHCAIGNTGFGDFPALMTKVALIGAALASDASWAGCVDHSDPRFGIMGALKDGAGNTFWGAEVSINIMQFLEV